MSRLNEERGSVEGARAAGAQLRPRSGEVTPRGGTEPRGVVNRFDDSVFAEVYEKLDAPRKPRGFPKRAAVVVGTLVLAGALLAYGWLRPIPPLNMSLAIVPIGSEVRITWTGGPARPDASHLKVNDGGHVRDTELTAPYESAGTMMFKPESSSIDVVWSVSSNGHVNRTEAASKLAPPAAVEPPDAGAAIRPTPQPHTSAAELERMRVHNRRMEALVKALRAKDRQKAGATP